MIPVGPRAAYRRIRGPRRGRGPAAPPPSRAGASPNPITSLVTPSAVFVSAALYLGLTAASVTHRDLLIGNNVTLPVLNASVPLTGTLGLCWIGPLLLLGLHASLLLRQYVVVQAALETGQLTGRSDPTFALVYPTIANPRSLPRWRLRYLVKGVYLGAIGGLPLCVLLVFQVFFLPYHGPKVTLWHQIFVMVDLALIWLFVGPMTTSSLSLRRSFSIQGPRHRRWWFVYPVRFLWLRPMKSGGAVLSAVVIFISLWAAVIPGSWAERCFGVAPWPSWLFPPIKRNLELQNEVLVHDVPAPELLVYELQHASPSADRERSLDDAWRRHSRGIRLSKRDFRNADFTGARLYRVVFREADLRGARLRGAHLEGADFSSDRTRLQGADLRESFLDRANFTGARMDGADLRGATGTEVIFEGAALPNVRMAEAHLGEMKASGARMDGADLTDGKLPRGTFDGASMVGAILTHAVLDGSTCRACDLRGSVLAGADARSVDFTSAQTQGAVFRGADLSSAVALPTPYVDLGQSRLDGANLGWATRSPAPSLTDLRGVTGLTEAPPPSSEPLLFDVEGRPAALDGVPDPASLAGFFSELAQGLVTEACAVGSPPQLMEALVRRSVGCFGPREPELERSLREIILTRIEAKGTARLRGTARPAGPDLQRAGSCAVLDDPPPVLAETLRAEGAAWKAGPATDAAPRPPYDLCGPAPVLVGTKPPVTEEPCGICAVARRLRWWDEGLTASYSQP